jgi:RNA polymerase sigma-70 factor (ECF subfamily)
VFAAAWGFDENRSLARPYLAAGARFGYELSGRRLGVRPYVWTEAPVTRWTFTVDGQQQVRQPAITVGLGSTFSCTCHEDRRRKDHELRGAPPALDVSAIYQEHLDYVWHSLRRLGVPEKDVPDVAHDVFLTVARVLPTYDPSRPLRPWLFVVAFRWPPTTCASTSTRARSSATPPSARDIGPTPEEALMDEDARKLVEDCLEAIDLPHRAVLVMHDVAGHAATTSPRPSSFLSRRSTRGCARRACVFQRRPRGSPRAGFTMTMNDDDRLPPLPPFAESLLEAERRRPPPTSRERRALWRRAADP